jgi:hypothetical protein
MNKPRTRIVKAYEWQPGPTVEVEQQRGPFTVDPMLRVMFYGERKSGGVPPDHELAHLALLLNTIYGNYKFFCKEVPNTTNQARADKVHDAFEILMHFFAERRQACESAGTDRQVVENERRLGDQFDKLMWMMGATPWKLDMDAGLYPSPYKSWRDLARRIAPAFQGVLEKNTGKRFSFGYQSPVVGLTKKALDIMADKAGDSKLRPKNRLVVAQHLKQPYRRKWP